MGPRGGLLQVLRAMLAVAMHVHRKHNYTRDRGRFRCDRTFGWAQHFDSHCCASWDSACRDGYATVVPQRKASDEYEERIAVITRSRDDRRRANVSCQHRVLYNTAA